jgi:hypothetical protein
MKTVWRGIAILCATFGVTVAAPATAALAVVGASSWVLLPIAEPTSFSAADDGNTTCAELGFGGDQYLHCDRYTVVLTNVGTRPSSGVVTVTDTLPEGVTTSKPPEGLVEERGENLPVWGCETEHPASREIVTCRTEGYPVPAQTAAPAIVIPISTSPVIPAGSVLTDEVTVSGGGAKSASASAATVAASPLEPAPSERLVPLGFGFSMLGPAGAQDTQAAGHPSAFTAAFTFPTADVYSFRKNEIEHVETPLPFPSEDARQVITDLPPGVIGDALATPTCPLPDVTDLTPEEVECPSSTRVGTLALVETNVIDNEIAIFNVAPERGHVAEFALFIPERQRAVLLYASLVGTGAAAHVRVETTEPNLLNVVGVSLTFFGDPAAIDETPLTPVAFETNPADCAATGFKTTMYLDTWQHPGKVEPDGEPDLSDPNWQKASSTSPPVTGCEALQFRPTFRLAPTSTAPDAPSGVNANLEVPQDEEPDALATPPLKDTTVTLPAGFVVSPSSATGLEGCSDAQIDLESNTLGSCPKASQIGTVTVRTPLLEEPVEGQVFLGVPECDPCSAADAASGRMVRAFIQVSSERYGLTLKIPGDVMLDPVTGRVTATFDNSPQQPFSDLEFHFKEGPRGPLATPSACGTYETVATLTPWSTPWTPSVSSPSSFTISGCTGNPFEPAFTAGTVSNQAGAYSPFELTLSRNDSEQDFGALEAVLPPGVSAKLAGVPECGEAEIAATRANAGECPAASQIGTVTVAAGPGSEPFYTSGKVYLTGAYNGGPFGEVTVVPGVAGPFNLGNVVIRGSLRVNSATAQGSVVSDPFPSILDGIPLQERSVHVLLERPAFTFNATSCEPLAVTGTVVSTLGTRAQLSSRYQAAGCQSLPFKPSFSASAQGAASKVDGASLDVRVSTHQGPDQGTAEEANIRKVDVQLPIALPSRLETLQKACTERQFAANPAGCPEGSVVGTAVANTPLLAAPLEGPAILVARGSEWPDLEILLQGDGVLVELTGETRIKKGITYSNFETAPDAPFSSFKLDLPEGPHAVLGANIPMKDYYDFCKLTKTVTTTKKVTRRVKGRRETVKVKVKTTEPEPLLMPTTITAQNGAVMTQDTKIALTGCPTAAAAKAAASRAGAAAREAAAKREAKQARAAAGRLSPRAV